MNFDTRIAVVVRDDLLTWQKLNVTAFTVSGMGSVPGMVGPNYIDGSGRRYLPMIKQPILIFGVTPAQIRDVYEQAVSANLELSMYTQELFSTQDDDANRAAVLAVESQHLKLVGLAMRGAKKRMEKVLAGLRLHP